MEQEEQSEQHFQARETHENNYDSEVLNKEGGKQQQQLEQDSPEGKKTMFSDDNNGGDF